MVNNTLVEDEKVFQCIPIFQQIIDDVPFDFLVLSGNLKFLEQEAKKSAKKLLPNWVPAYMKIDVVTRKLNKEIVIRCYLQGGEL